MAVGLGLLLLCSAAGPQRAVALSAYSLNPDCTFLGQSNPFSLQDSYCEFSITDFSVTTGLAGSSGTPAAVHMSWSDGKTPVAELGEDAGTRTIVITVNWGDGHTDTWDLWSHVQPLDVSPAQIASCDTSRIFTGPAFPQPTCDRGASVQDPTATPITHNYLGTGSYTVGVTVRLNLASYCSLPDGCPAGGPPPYFMESYRSATVTTGTVVPTVNYSLSGLTAPAPYDAVVGQPISMTLNTASASGYYNVYVGWIDQNTPMTKLDTGIPGTGAETWGPNLDLGGGVYPLRHTYTHTGTYLVSAQVAACTLEIGTNNCVETSVGNLAISTMSQVIDVGPAPIAVTVSGSQIYGATRPTFTYSNGTLPAGAAVSGTTVTCATVDGGTPITPSLAAGTHKIDPSSCSGITSSDATDYPIQYSGKFTVSPGVAVSVAGTMDFYAGNQSFTYTVQGASPNSAVGVTGTVTCTTVDGGTAINGSNFGTHTLDGWNCSGLTATDPSYGVTYSGTMQVNRVPLPVPVTGTWAFGQTPVLTPTIPAQPFVDFGGTVGFCAVDVPPNGAYTSSSLPVGTWNISYCGGLTLTGPWGDNFYLVYTGSVTVTRSAIPAAVSGTWPYGQTPQVTVTPTAPQGVTVTGTATCSTVDGGMAITSSLAAGTHAIDATSCSGLSGPSGSTIDYAGSVQVNPAHPTVTVSGGPFTYNGLGHGASAGAVGIDGSTAVAGTFSFTYTPGGSTVPVYAGTYQVTATFTSNDANYTGSTGTGSITITQVAPTLSITSTANPSILGQPVSFGATITSAAGSPTGQVQFTVDGSNLGSPVALSNGKATSPTVSGLAIGSHNVDATYLGDTNFSSVTRSFLQNVTYRVVALFSQTAINRRGSMVPVRVELQNWAGRDLSAPTILVTLSSPALSPSPAPGAQPKGSFTWMWSPAGPFYQYNIKTTGYPRGTYALSFSVRGDPVTHTVHFVIG